MEHKRDEEEDLLPQQEQEPQGANAVLEEHSGGARGSGDLLTILVSSAGTLIAAACASLLTRYYFDAGGSSRWLTAVVQAAGWPLPALASVLGSSSSSTGKFHPPSSILMLVYAAMGFLQSSSNLAYDWGSSFLPASTSGVLTSTQLLFNVAFSMLLLKHRPSQLAWTSISLVTCSALLLALDSSHDSVANVTRSQHALGFAAALFASFSCGLTYVLVELIFAKFPSCSSNPQQVVAWILFFSMFIPVAGLVLTGELGSIPQESQNFQDGPLAYYSTLSLATLAWPVYALCSTILVSTASSVLVGVTQGALIPIVPIFAVAFFHDHFGVLKALSTLLAIAGFTAYIKVFSK